MEKDARLFNCARCHKQTVICGCCDRGNIYCDPACSKAARRASLRAAGRRYQNSRQEGDSTMLPARSAIGTVKNNINQMWT